MVIRKWGTRLHDTVINVKLQATCPASFQIIRGSCSARITTILDCYGHAAFNNHVVSLLFYIGSRIATIPAKPKDIVPEHVRPKRTLLTMSNVRSNVNQA